MISLITDRKQEDVVYLKSLWLKGWSNLTDEEKNFWQTNAKGAYNAPDANRVGQAVLFLQSYLNSVQDALDAHRALYGVAADTIFNITWGQIALTVKTDWKRADIPTPEQLTVYLQNVNDVSAAITITRHLPSGMDNLTVQGANEIERVLEAEYAAGLDFAAIKKQLIENTAAAWFYSGDIYGGEI